MREYLEIRSLIALKEKAAYEEYQEFSKNFGERDVATEKAAARWLVLSDLLEELDERLEKMAEEIRESLEAQERR